MDRTPKDILKQYWGFDEFRPLQEDIIKSVLVGKDTLALLPTGGGKSICFQVPALVKGGICIVVSPLIALMQDQVKNLNDRGISAVSIDSSLHFVQIDRILDSAVNGQYSFLYLSPERLRNEVVQARIERMNVSLIAVDEAHCISQWGYDFRPPYLQVAEIRKLVPNAPILALTATATPRVVDDIQEKLEFAERNVLQKSFSRSNLAYMVLQEQDQMGRIKRILDRIEGTSIIYVRNRRRTAEVAKALNGQGISSTFYHAGLSSEERKRRQSDWINGSVRVVVATNAFGMGIDKPDVRTVIHLGMPDGLEAYFQEAGRAGRDGEKSFAVALIGPSEVESLQEAAEQILPERAVITRVYECLANMHQIPIGSGEDRWNEFDLFEFCDRYDMEARPVMSSLNVLERSEMIELTESFDSRPRMSLIASSETVHQAKVSEPIHGQFLEVLTRSYGRIQEEPAPVNLKLIAKRLTMSLDKVEKIVARLQDMKILHFEKASNLPKFAFVGGRVDKKSIHLPKEVYENRIVLGKRRINSVIQYIQNDQFCRSQMLLKYFGETDTKHCGQCDVCLSLDQSQLTDGEFEEISTKLVDQIAEAEYEVSALTKEFRSVSGRKVLRTVQLMLDEGVLETTNSGKVKLVKD